MDDNPGNGGRNGRGGLLNQEKWIDGFNVEFFAITNSSAI
jgi:hypothetical protein